MQLDAAILKELMHYDPETGVMTWLKKIAAKQYIGDRVGSIDDEGYARTKIQRKTYKLHRLIWLYMTGEWPEDEVDHKDRNRLNNRWLNLRAATHKQNSQNRNPRHDSTSKSVGVSWSSRDGLWCASISIDGRKRQVGSSKSLEKAIALRAAAAKQHYMHSEHTRV